MDEEAAWALIGAAASVFVAKGKKQLKFVPDKGLKTEILKHVLGRTGNLRAPTVKQGETIWVGFNSQIYAELR